MEELWHSILEFTSQFVIPDWGELINLLPVLLAGLVILWFAWTIRRFATAGPTRRAPARVEPVAPPGLHMPGPSYAPVLGALGAAALMWGFVVGGTGLVIGAIVLVLTLLWWGREALRDYDHLTHAETLPAVVHPGPPPGVHMPGPSFRPVLGAVGTAALMYGIVFGGWVLAAGVIILVLTLVGWLVDAGAEYRERVKADVTGHLENPPAPRWPKGLLQSISVLFVLAVLLQAGIIPPRAPAGGEEPGGSPLPTGPGGPGGPPPVEQEVIAVDTAFNTTALEVPQGQAFRIVFENQDAPGVIHDIDIRLADGTVVSDQPVVNGGESATYEYDPLDAGEYVFICSIHPIPRMTGTLTSR